jgi:hypothetical protein
MVGWKNKKAIACLSQNGKICHVFVVFEQVPGALPFKYFR